MGSPSEELDEKGRPKVKCMECGKFYHRLDVHLPKHDMKVAEYLVKYPGAKTISDAASERASKAQQRASNAGIAAIKDMTAKTAKASSGEKLADGEGWLDFGPAKLRISEGLSPYDQMFVPAHDEGWIPGATEQRMLEELACAWMDDDNCLIVGPHGIGKTTLVAELAAILNRPLRPMSFDGGTRNADLVGEKVVIVDEATGQSITSYIPGVLVDAGERGHIFLANEIDAMPPQYGLVMQSLLERPRRLVLTQDGGRVIKFHPDFRFVATANTLGLGDDTGAYAGTNVLNHAFLDRFGMTIKADYPDEATEVNILVKRSGVDADVARGMVRVAVKIREAYAKDECFTAISTRRLIDWAKKHTRFKDARRAAELTVLNKMSKDDAAFVGLVIQRHFGGKL